MSLVKIEEVFEVGSTPENFAELSQCCDRHFLVNLEKWQDFKTSLTAQQLQTIVVEKDYRIASLERENAFLKEQVNSLNTLLDQLSTSTRNLATRNDIRIKVENSSTLTFKKWYRRPRIILTGSAIAVLFSVYLRYKIKNW